MRHASLIVCGLLLLSACATQTSSPDPARISAEPSNPRGGVAPGPGVSLGSKSLTVDQVDSLFSLVCLVVASLKRSSTAMTE